MATLGLCAICVVHPMSTLYLLPIAYTLFVWWLSTGVILYLNGLPRWTYRWTMLGSTVLLCVALVGLATTRDDTRVTGAYLAFTCTVLVWAWQELAFLLGYVTGPRRTPCPAGSTGWRRASFALQTLLHHELALLVLGAAVVATTWGGSNATGPATFLIFWVMRQSAKLNVFLGVRNLSEDFLPRHLQYLQTYFRRAPMNPLFPISVAVSSWFAVLLWQAAGAQGIGGFDATMLTFVGTLLSLAILEHWFMVLPLPSQALWNWGLRSRTPDPPT
jgi:putative photosynthetic complex assembly protein 2